MLEAEEEGFLFDGLKVLDVATWIAAPVATTILADYGASVIKVEMPGPGDAYRHFAGMPGTPTADANYTWLLDGRNKRSLALNLKTRAGLDILKRLIGECDVYVTNHPLPLRRELGLTYEDIRGLNERMIYASVTAYGEAGPERDREGFDLVAYWSRTGLMDLVRSTPDTEPAHSLPGMGDHPSAISLYASIVTALLRRERTGKGSHVHTSLMANGLWSASCIAQAKFCNADFSMHRHPEHMPFTRGLCQAADGRWLQFTMVRTPEEIGGLLEVLGGTHLLEDPRFATPEDRYLRGSEMIAEIRPLVAARTSAEWMTAFKAARVPAALIGTLDDLLVDPQLAINGMVTEPVEDVGADLVVNHPLNVDGLPRVGVKKAPEVGEHSLEVLAEMGLDDDAIGALLRDDVI